jgi:hypothetical protein
MREGDAMRHFVGAVMAASLCLTAGCSGSTQSNANKGDALIASGFKMVPANTPERQAALRQLPPQKFVRKLHQDKVVFLYADPANCNCVYAGNLTAYSAYRASMQDKKLADAQAMDNWDWPDTFGFPD